MSLNKNNDFITGIQQVGIGVTNAIEAKNYYKDLFGMNVLVFDDRSSASLMTKYTDNEVHDRHAMLTMNLGGGGGFEIWQYTSRTPTAQPNINLGDIGIYAIKIKTIDIIKAYQFYSNAKNIIVSEIHTNPLDEKYFWIKDVFANVFQMVECKDIYITTSSICAGVCGAIIGVSNINNAADFYKNALGIGKVKYEIISRDVVFGKSVAVKKMLLIKNRNQIGAFCNLLGDVQIELVEALDSMPVKIFQNRFWGDCGFIHLCFDVINMNELKRKIETAEYSFTVDSINSFAMENASGRFCYIEDPDGTLIELVETHKIPIIKKVGWYIYLAKRKANNPLPKWMIRMLGFSKA
jgi:catechol 2,3-dioxygenase-like lactoylglutathione lyase family enzyme